MASRRSRAATTPTSSTSSCSILRRRVALFRGIIAACLVAVSLALIVDGAQEIVGFARWYTSLFINYYTPKLTSARTVLRRLSSYVPDTVATELYEAWDLSTAVIVVTSVYHLIERLRRHALAKLR